MAGSFYSLWSWVTWRTKWFSCTECWYPVMLWQLRDPWPIRLRFLLPRWNNFKFQPVVSALVLLSINCLYHGMCVFRHARNKLADDIHAVKGDRPDFWFNNPKIHIMFKRYLSLQTCTSQSLRDLRDLMLDLLAIPLLCFTIVMWLMLKDDTLHGADICPFQCTFEDDFLFLKVKYVSCLEGIIWHLRWFWCQSSCSLPFHLSQTPVPRPKRSHGNNQPTLLTKSPVFLRGGLLKPFSQVDLMI